MKMFNLGFITILLSGCGIQMAADDQKQRIIIPEGFEGSITVIYNVKDSPKLKRKDTYDIVPIQVKDIETQFTELELYEESDLVPYGIYHTSSKIPAGYDYELFYEDNEGKRTPIDEYCTHFDGLGGTSVGDIEVDYVSIHLTKTNCGAQFFLNGEDKYGAQANVILNEWLERMGVK